jgi:cation transport regulator ChaB
VVKIQPDFDIVPRETADALAWKAVKSEFNKAEEFSHLPS